MPYEATTGTGVPSVTSFSIAIAGVVDVRASIGPVVDDVVVVGDLDVVEVDGAELRHLRDEEVGEALPARAAGVGGTALGLEHVPVPRLIGRDHELRVDLGKREARPAVRRRERLGPQRSPRQDRAGGDAGGGLEEVPPRRTGCLLPRFAHRFLPYFGHFRSRLVRVSPLAIVFQRARRHGDRRTLRHQSNVVVPRIAVHSEQLLMLIQCLGDSV